MEYLGFIVSHDGIEMDPTKTELISAWPAPRSLGQLQSFLGFSNFYRRFIKNYSALTRPLNELTRKSVPYSWSAECQQAFDDIKAAFNEAPLLNHFKPELQILVETDASDYVIAAILSQIDEDGNIFPIAFHSRTMTAPERNYPIYDKELLAIRDAFGVWRRYLEGSSHQVEVITDHKNLEWFSTTKQLSRRQARWSEYLHQFDFIIKYRPGKLGEKPDALTRRPDLYPSPGESGYASANPQNFVQLLKDGQLVRTTTENKVLDSSLILDLIREGITTDPTSAEQLTRMRSSTSETDSEYELSPSGFLLFRKRLFVPNYKDVRL